MGIDISKLTKLVTDLCSETKCKFDCCHECVPCEFDNKDTILSRDSESTLATLSQTTLAPSEPSHAQK